VSSLVTGPGGTDLASGLSSRTTKSILNSVELDRLRSASLQSSWVVLLGSGGTRGANELAVLVARVESGLGSVKMRQKGEKGNLLCRHTCSFGRRTLIYQLIILKGRK
jgi:hypothetical protein